MNPTNCVCVYPDLTNVPHKHNDLIGSFPTIPQHLNPTNGVCENEPHKLCVYSNLTNSLHHFARPPGRGLQCSHRELIMKFPDFSLIFQVGKSEIP